MKHNSNHKKKHQLKTMIGKKTHEKIKQMEITKKRTQ